MNWTSETAPAIVWVCTILSLILAGGIFTATALHFYFNRKLPTDPKARDDVWRTRFEGFNNFMRLDGARASSPALDGLRRKNDESGRDARAP